MHVIEDDLTHALFDLMSFLNSPRQDEVLLRAAGVSLDRALFPILARLGLRGALSVVDLADMMDKDPSTVSRQVAKLEELGLLTRRSGEGDRRVRAAAITDAGREVVERITQTRRQTLHLALSNWSEAERESLPRLIRRLVADLKALQPLKL